MLESQRHPFKGTGVHCEQCPHMAAHWVHQVNFERNRRKSDRDLLMSLAEANDHDHDIEKCGMCYHRWIMQQCASELLQFEYATISSWSGEVDKRWRDSKYYKLWQTEADAGRDPKIAFAERGWET